MKHDYITTIDHMHDYPEIVATLHEASKEVHFFLCGQMIKPG